MLAHQMARGVSRLLGRVQAGLALRGVAEQRGDVRLIGAPQIRARGRLVLGHGVTLVNEPTPVRITVAEGGSLEIGDGVVIGSGSTIVATGSVRIGAGAELGAACVITDLESTGEAGAAAEGIAIGAGARLETRVTLLRGAVIAEGARVARASIVSAAGSRAEPVSAAPTANGSADAVLEQLRSVVAQVVSTAFALGPDEDVKQLEGWDSLSAIHVLVALESAFEVTLPSSLFERASSLRSLAEVVARALEQR